ncbi:MAG TPA: hypothetical protein VEH31_15255, partial [Streptosporangiaceae bacterium]|nr:hypothetical protein [Streptosporangiaceae bacterium]
MAPDDLTLEAGARLLHIGPHKTGTSAIQGAFHLARGQLAEHGVVYAGTGRQPMRPALAVTGRPAMLGEARPEMAHWDKLVQDVAAAGDQRVVISSEFFDEADDTVARRIVADLGGPRVHVVVTLRPLAKVMPSQWQQFLQNGLCTPYLEYLGKVLRPSGQTPRFWQRHRHDELIARWVAAAGAHNVTVIVVDGSDRLTLLRTFESLVGLPAGFLVPEDDVVNRSLTLAESEVVRQLNEEFRRRGWPEASYARFLRYGAVRQMKARQPLPGEPEIATPAWALERVAEISAEMTRNIAALGVRVIGDISALGASPAPARSPEAGTEAGSAIPPIPVEAAVQAVLGAILAGGMADQAADADGRAVADRLVREVDARRLAGVLV